MEYAKQHIETEQPWDSGTKMIEARTLQYSTVEDAELAVRGRGATETTKRQGTREPTRREM